MTPVYEHFTLFNVTFSHSILKQWPMKWSTSKVYTQEDLISTDMIPLQYIHVYTNLGHRMASYRRVRKAKTLHKGKNLESALFSYSYNK